jgi:hypothetical protein
MPGGWSASFTVHSGGKTHGSHVSGGDRPFEHIEKGSLDGNTLKEIISTAERVYRSKIPSQPIIRTNELVCIHVQPFVGTAKTYQRKVKAAFSDKELAALDRLMHKHRIGAW